MTVDQIVELAINERALQRRGELALLVDLVLDLQPRTVLEIGTCHGGSLAAWCQCATPDARIVSIDLPHGQFGGTDANVHGSHLLSYRREAQDLRLVTGDSHDALIHAAIAPLFTPDGIDFLFIDGDHTYDGVRQDFETYARMVRPGGLIAFHDVAPHDGDARCEVDRLWAEIAPQYEMTWTFRTEGDYAGCGIGVIRWPGKPCAACGGRGWHTAGGNDAMTCSCAAGAAYEGWSE